ncbi:hypothetical protein GOP47_0001026 [Adiantum capillus-veneris]|uniref:Uncharacterized protein n=1 Tax=Adiantum capillus-veneris TaxID=13818 RepID=A0A9D4VEL3_ADICA|nr:hypothetical protein GOP47_0001026 [Adiantum capillus-veneris]
MALRMINGKMVTSLLASVGLSDILGTNAPSRVVLNLPSSLKNLDMKRILNYSVDHGAVSNPTEPTTLVLHADNLKFLYLKGVSIRKRGSVEVEQVRSLQRLILRDFQHIEWFHFADTLQGLVLWNVDIKHLAVETLTSLTKLTLFNDNIHIPTMWPTYRKLHL